MATDLAEGHKQLVMLLEKGSIDRDTSVEVSKLALGMLMYLQQTYGLKHLKHLYAPRKRYGVFKTNGSGEVTMFNPFGEEEPPEMELHRSVLQAAERGLQLLHRYEESRPNTYNLAYFYALVENFREALGILDAAAAKRPLDPAIPDDSRLLSLREAIVTEAAGAGSSSPE